MIDRYDRVAKGYRQCWQPVLHPGGERLLDRIDRVRPDLREGAEVRVLDVGCGTGSQSLVAVERWPGAKVTGLDASEGMLMVARGGRRSLEPDARSRLEFVRADAAAIPFGDGAFDVLISAFLLQLVPDRAEVLREMHRVLRPDGVAGVATWLQERDDLRFGPDQAFDESLAELGVTRPERHEVRAGDFASVDGATEELTAAGFGVIETVGDALDYEWTPESYATYKRVSREVDTFGSLEPEAADRLAATVRARLDSLYAADPSAFRFRPPFVVAVARKPAE